MMVKCNQVLNISNNCRCCLQLEQLKFCVICEVFECKCIIGSFLPIFNQHAQLHHSFVNQQTSWEMRGYHYQLSNSFSRKYLTQTKHLKYKLFDKIDFVGNICIKLKIYSFKPLSYHFRIRLPWLSFKTCLGRRICNVSCLHLLDNSI